MKRALLFLALLPAAAFAEPDLDQSCAGIVMMERLHAAYVRQLPPADPTAAVHDAEQIWAMRNLICGNTFRRGASAYYPDGKLLTASYGWQGASWYWPNGTLMTAAWNRRGASLYWPNGRLVTASLGMAGASWYFANGRLLSASLGMHGATLSCPDGSALTSSGPALDDASLFDAGGTMRWVVRACRRELARESAWNH
jgi:hypothetical protein